VVDDHQYFQPDPHDIAHMHQHQQALVSTHHETMQIDMHNNHVNNFMIPHHQNHVHGEVQEYTKHPSPVTANQHNQAHGAQNHMFDLQLKHSQSLVVPSTSYV